MSPRLTEGQRGNAAENVVYGVLRSKRYTQLTSGEVNDASLELPWFVPQYRGFIGIYNRKLRLDCFVFHPEKWSSRLAVEVKWQQVPGSVDEKYPYTVKNLASLPCPAVIMLGGEGYSDGARDWLVAQQSPSLEVVVGMDAVMRWSNTRF